MSPSSIAWQTPTATASWPIATCRKPGSSPARNRSSTFSSKRRMRSISRRKSRSVSSFRARFLSTLAKAPAVYVLKMSVARQWKVIGSELPDVVGARLAPARAARPRRRRPGRCNAGPDRPLPRLADDPAVLGRPRRERSRTPRHHATSLAHPDGHAVAVEFAGLAPGSPSARSPRSWRAGTPRSPVCPSDWSDLYAEIEFTSSDYIEPAAVLCIQMNPRRDGTRAAFNFRAAPPGRLRRRARDGAPLLRALRREGDPRLDQRAARAQRHPPRRDAGPRVALRRQDALS